MAALSYNPQQWYTSNSTNLVWTTGAVTSAVVTASVPPAKPRKKSALDWLEFEVEKVCALTREAVPS